MCGTLPPLTQWRSPKEPASASVPCFTPYVVYFLTSKVQIRPERFTTHAQLPCIPAASTPSRTRHLDIIKRSSRMFDKVIVAVLVNSAKTPLFTVEERVAMLRECCKNIPNVEVDSFNGLTVTFAKQKHATVMVRGLRAVTDFENEIQLAHTNFAMMPGSKRCSWPRP